MTKSSKSPKRIQSRGEEIANSLSHGTRTGFATSIGSTAGTAVLLAVGGFGMAWVLQLMADWLIWIRWAGAAYLIEVLQSLDEGSQAPDVPWRAKTLEN